MTQEQIIAQLKSLKSDAESHREKDGTIDDVYADDNECSDCPISKSIGALYLYGSKAVSDMTMEQLDYLIAKIDEAEAVK